MYISTRLLIKMYAERRGRKVHLSSVFFLLLWSFNGHMYPTTNKISYVHYMYSMYVHWHVACVSVWHNNVVMTSMCNILVYFYFLCCQNGIQSHSLCTTLIRYPRNVPHTSNSCCRKFVARKIITVHTEKCFASLAHSSMQMTVGNYFCCCHFVNILFIFLLKYFMV